MMSKMNQTNNTFEELAKEMVALHDRKNADYGNAFGNTYQEFAQKSKEMANGYALGSIKNKVKRLVTLMSGQKANVDVSIEDSLIDLASYSLMTLAEIRKLNNHETELMTLAEIRKLNNHETE